MCRTHTSSPDFSQRGSICREIPSHARLHGTHQHWVYSWSRRSARGRSASSSAGCTWAAWQGSWLRRPSLNTLAGKLFSTSSASPVCVVLQILRLSTLLSETNLRGRVSVFAADSTRRYPDKHS